MQMTEKNRRARASTAMKADINEVIEQLNLLAYPHQFKPLAKLVRLSCRI